MSDSIPAGSYLIRHVPTGHVLFDAGNNKLKAEKRDEGNPLYREAQVWWIEPIPEQQKFFDKAPTLYTITQLAQEKSLDAPDKKHLHLHKSHGAPWQLWKFERREDCKECMYSGLAIDRGNLNRGYESSKLNLHLQWELVIPMSSVPIGWHQLKNVSTGNILSHSYPSSLPILISPTGPNHTSNYRETWGTQWTIIHNRALVGGNAVASFQIRNRLTGGFLRARGTMDPTIPTTMEDTVRAWQTCPSGGEKLWTLELDGRRNWKIVEEATGNLLGEALGRSFGGGNTLECSSKQLDPRRSWKLVPMEEVDTNVTNVRFSLAHAQDVVETKSKT
ncbi:hypothetical protein BZA05DRAFT_414224 [Tricharina praecox]|uniref:uncharacterized protein n=1 Tax=Tricharina praecox TaxID=43433 RepID=UPI00221FA556|nr:uncharacterized protein BZA05DRAFT_414224 [Tricharina praecox]KAI5858411.1 hypothetical protein BZA05DRAFT_414224 [Tricharina praecox]